jgi:CHAT domain-containing protein
VQHSLLGQDQSLLEYFVGDSAVYIFLVNPDDYEVISMEKDFPLEDWVTQLRKGLTAQYISNEPTDSLYQNSTYSADQYVKAAHFLYEKLIAPVKEKLKTKVTIIPDGVLGYLPFQVLLKEKPSRSYRFHSHKYLGLDHQISYSYSATLLRQMQAKQHKKVPEKSLLAMAPYYDGSLYFLDSLYQEEQKSFGISEEVNSRSAFNPLPYSGIEAYSASQLWGGDFLQEEAATEDQFIQLAGDYRILHLATHGEANDEVGEYAYLAFTEVKDSLENELLYIKDIYNLQLNADLVILSACQTGTGRLQKGEGIISLARAFAYAGAKSILTTLWKVDDQKSKDLMVLFHQLLLKGEDKDTALWKAQKQYLKRNKGQSASPFFWAPFIGVGSMEALK